MNTLRQALNEYLALRQALGFKLQEESRLLPRFIAFLEAHGETFITTDMAVRWATQCRTTQPAEWTRRLRFVRIFARYRSATDPRTQIPSTGLLPYRARRAEPYIYNDDEINRRVTVIPSVYCCAMHSNGYTNRWQSYHWLS